MQSAKISIDMSVNQALDIVDNRMLYTDFLQRNFGPEWNTVDVAEVQKKLVEAAAKNCRF